MDYAIVTNGLTKNFGAVSAVDDVNLRVNQGEMYGFLGLNGAGKTTTIRALLGLIHPSAGSIQLLGQAVGPMGRGPWRQVGHLVEAPSAYPDLTVKENLHSYILMLLAFIAGMAATFTWWLRADQAR